MASGVAVLLSDAKVLGKIFQLQTVEEEFSINFADMLREEHGEELVLDFSRGFDFVCKESLSEMIHVCLFLFLQEMK